MHVPWLLILSGPLFFFSTRKHEVPYAVARSVSSLSSKACIRYALRFPVLHRPLNVLYSFQIPFSAALRVTPSAATRLRRRISCLSFQP